MSYLGPTPRGPNRSAGVTLIPRVMPGDVLHIALLNEEETSVYLPKNRSVRVETDVRALRTKASITMVLRLC